NCCTFVALDQLHGHINDHGKHHGSVDKQQTRDQHRNGCNGHGSVSLQVPKAFFQQITKIMQFHWTSPLPLPHKWRGYCPQSSSWYLPPLRRHESEPHGDGSALPDYVRG